MSLQPMLALRALSIYDHCTPHRINNHNGQRAVNKNGFTCDPGIYDFNCLVRSNLNNARYDHWTPQLANHKRLYGLLGLTTVSTSAGPTHSDQYDHIKMDQTRPKEHSYLDVPKVPNFDCPISVAPGKPMMFHASSIKTRIRPWNRGPVSKFDARPTVKVPTSSVIDLDLVVQMINLIAES